MMLNKFNPLQSRFTRTTIPFAIAIMLGGNSANATPFPTELSSFKNQDFLEILQVVSQSNSRPRDVIVDTNPGRNPDSRSTTRNSFDTRFGCELVNGEYTVMYYPESQPNTSYPWAVPSQLGSGWSPERRCNEISRRLESYRADGLLEMTTGEENGYNTVCVTTQIDPTDCRIVLTVPPGQDPQLTRDLIFENLLIADDGLQTQGVYTYREQGNSNDILNDISNILGGKKTPSFNNGTDGIDLRPFLDPKDGGTGTELDQDKSSGSNSTNSSNLGIKPAIFR